MPSDHYQTTVDAHNQFHKNYPNKWTGYSTMDYKDQIKELVNKHQAKSLLDYGCGKAHHYERNVVLNFGTKQNPLTFDEFLGVKDVYKYDPCVDEYLVLPSKDKKFDAVIAIQCLSLVPDDDIPWVKDLLQSYTGKFCFIANQDPGSYVKPCKAELTSNPDYFKVKRTKEWYYEQFANWSGSELVIYFHPGRTIE